MKKEANAIQAKSHELGPDNDSATQKNVGLYQRATTAVISELSEDTKETYQALAEQWNAQSPPPEVQAE